MRRGTWAHHRYPEGRSLHLRDAKRGWSSGEGCSLPQSTLEGCSLVYSVLTWLGPLVFTTDMETSLNFSFPLAKLFFLFQHSTATYHSFCALLERPCLFSDMITNDRAAFLSMYPKEREPSLSLMPLQALVMFRAESQEEVRLATLYTKRLPSRSCPSWGDVVGAFFKVNGTGIKHNPKAGHRIQ